MILIKVTRGIIDQVTFYDSAMDAVRALSEHAEAMNLENEDAAVFDRDGFVANAKDFFDDEDIYMDNSEAILKGLRPDAVPVYIIANPHHLLGFMVASFDDPLGYTDPVEALSDLGQMRKDHGIRFTLYRVMEMTGPVASKDDLRNLVSDCEVEGFDCSLVEEYLEKPG